MAHSIKAKIPEIEISNIDFEFDISGENGKIGKLKISKGNIRWSPSGNSVNEFQLSWTKFAKLMEAGKAVKS